MTARIEFTTDRRDNPFGGWSRNCRVDGVEYQCSVKRGRPVRIPYKPRGKNRGWKWNGTVYSGGRYLWSGDVAGSIGVRGLLLEAGVQLEKESNDDHD